jgi:hypothetical protein
MVDTSLSVVELFTDFKYNGVSKLDLRGDLMIDLIVDFLATIGDIIVDIWVKYSLQGTTQGRYLTGGVPPVRFSM